MNYRGAIQGKCKLVDIVFCQYLHNKEQVSIIAFPRKESLGKRELRERRFLRIDFYNKPKSLYTTDYMNYGIILSIS